MKPIKPWSAGMQSMITSLYQLAEHGDAKSMTTLAGLLMSYSVEMQDASLLDEAERWFLAAAANEEPLAKSFVEEAWPEAKEFFRAQISPRAA